MLQDIGNILNFKDLSVLQRFLMSEKHCCMDGTLFLCMPMNKCTNILVF